eukprot:Skav234106  [mRNA]  locus=scaffold2732:36736:40142:+ [translate_table: standard]
MSWQEAAGGKCSPFLCKHITAESAVVHTYAAICIEKLLRVKDKTPQASAELQVASRDANEVKDAVGGAERQPAPSFDEDAEAALEPPGRLDDFERRMFQVLIDCAPGVYGDAAYWTDGMSIVRRPDPSAPDGFAYSVEEDF